jgi:putative transposase
MESALERMLDTEMNVHLGREALPTPAPDPSISDSDTPKNRRNGHSPEAVRGELGELTLGAPRDRRGTFEPQLIPKHQRRLTGSDEKILALYAKDLTTRDIHDIVKELYDVDVSPPSSPRSPPIHSWRVGPQPRASTVKCALTTIWR